MSEMRDEPEAENVASPELPGTFISIYQLNGSI